MEGLRKLPFWAILLVVMQAGCASPSTISATLAATAAPEAATAGPGLPVEAIQILTPGAGSVLVGQAHVEGIADSTFEQNLVIQVVQLGEPETILAQQPVTIQAELGQRGPFVADLSFAPPGDGDPPGEVRVFAASPRDGGITHLASNPVTLAASGEPVVRTAAEHAERIVVTSPAPGDSIRGGIVHVEGVALASFEQTLVAEIHDVDGGLIGQAPITVRAPDLGLPGPFSVDVPYVLATAGAGRLTVRDPSPAFGQTLHLASVEIQIEP